MNEILAIQVDEIQVDEIIAMQIDYKDAHIDFVSPLPFAPRHRTAPPLAFSPRRRITLLIHILTSNHHSHSHLDVAALISSYVAHLCFVPGRCPDLKSISNALTVLAIIAENVPQRSSFTPGERGIDPVKGKV